MPLQKAIEQFESNFVIVKQSQFLKFVLPFGPKYVFLAYQITVQTIRITYRGGYTT
jgi:hypothetical protein